MECKLLSVVITTALFCGCNSDSSSDSSNTSDPMVVSSMSIIKEGFQTFKPRSHNLTGFYSKVALGTKDAPFDDGASRYAHENPGTGELSSILFSGSELEPEEQPPELTIDSVVDLNEVYSAISMSNITIEVNNEVMSGNFTVIQDKVTGALYPLVEDGKPIYRDIDAEHEAWITKTRFSNNGDPKRIYLRHGEGKSLHKAELNDGIFVISKIFDDYFSSEVILPSGDIVSKRWDAETSIIWREANGNTHILDYNTSLSVPFLVDDELYAMDYSDGSMQKVAFNGAEIVLGDSGWKANGYSPLVTESVVRGEYRMHWDCSVFKFDSTAKVITQLFESKPNYGIGNGGQNSLFCMYSDNDAQDELPKFIRFEIDKAIAGEDPISEVEASGGLKLDANERLVVVSDNEVMFYEYPSGSFTERYVSFDDGTTVEKLVDSRTVIVMQTINAK
ncbi:hypothetical protein LMH73_007360 [Vibrio splendidus]|nr:hypothetical protein [Vibrio splendidus]MCC4883129.1 hypothetical protein [Vibrio splendidus]